MSVRFLTILLFSLLLIFLTSCSLERRLASDFIKEANNQSIVLQFPDYVVKTSLKTDTVRDLKIKDSFVLDSLRFQESLVLKYVNDSKFLAGCKQSMIKELNAYGINVIEHDQFDGNSVHGLYFLNLAQIQLEEYQDSATIDKFCYGQLHFFDLTLNALNINSWFELSKLDEDSVKFPVLYSSYYQFDEVKGSCLKVFAKYGKKVMYNYKVDTIDAQTSYKLASEAGKRYASNFFDYLLNIYVQDHLPEGKTPYFYHHYDHRKNVVRNLCEDAFVEMDP